MMDGDGSFSGPSTNIIYFLTGNPFIQGGQF